MEDEEVNHHYAFILQNPKNQRTIEGSKMMTSSPIVVEGSLSAQNLIDLNDSGNIFVTDQFIRQYWRRFINSLQVEDNLSGSRIHVCTASENEILALMPVYQHLIEKGVEVFIWTTHESSQQLLRPGFRFVLYRRNSPLANEKLFLAETPAGSRVLFMWHDLSLDTNGNTLRGVLVTNPDNVKRIGKSLNKIVAGNTS